MQNLGKKLQLKPGSNLLLLNAPAEVADILAAEGYTSSNAALAGSYQAVLLLVHSKQELEQFAPQSVAALKPEGMLWIAYPKKTSGIKSDLTRDKGWKVLADLGYAPIRQVAVDDTWSALRFKHASERKEPSKFGTDMPGIDRTAKTVVPPADMQQALDAAGVTALFQQLAFTHRKEYVVAVLEAKRPETRAKRIAETVKALKARLT
ncbi:YdeI/OmpD-associated family protein [Pontibacter sp. 172403-2]|uniref:YdeI/OmpD-associated family protein n=1 Tax=Pontibacter rufus TaxID=2791028 RepID=UPI0018AFCE3F|nr:YdeI/OmpD-associated family protein [Pontibacter sp. 172403-2]MBF9252939.1 YdeI/OmpD-associated family protein [Pontibacter sp. 172403-2]